MDPDLSDPTRVLAMTVWAEVRSGGYDAMSHVASVVLNRAHWARWWGHDILSVCLARWQFSSWNPHTVGTAPDRNYEAMIAVTDADPLFAAALDIAGRAVAGSLPDQTGGADSYYALSIDPPLWTRGATHTLDDGWHSFWITRHLAHAPAAYEGRGMTTTPPPHEGGGVSADDPTTSLPRGEGDVSADALNAAELAKFGGGT